MKSKIGIIGAGGLIGTALLNSLEKIYDIRIIKSINLYSIPETIAPMLEDLNIIINLAGYPIAGRWSNKKKQLIYNSRILTTRNLVSAIGLLKQKPYQLINASAVGIYNDNELCDENSINFAENFLSKLVLDWEREVSNVGRFGVEYSILRFGVVLSRSGGAYDLLRKVFKYGMGGTIGSGMQGFSYILIDDLVEIMTFIIKTRIFGVINVVSPDPVINKLFTAEISRRFKKPSFFKIPAFVIKMIYGEGSIVILNGQKVIPKRLLDEGFVFVGKNLTTCLNFLEK